LQKRANRISFVANDSDSTANYTREIFVVFRFNQEFITKIDWPLHFANQSEWATFVDADSRRGYRIRMSEKT